jgi:hypothetical protein
MSSFDDPARLVWSRDNRGHLKVHEVAGHRRVAPRTPEEAIRFAASEELLAAAEGILAVMHRTYFADYGRRDEFRRLVQAVANAKGGK